MQLLSRIVGYPITIVEYHSIGSIHTRWDITPSTLGAQLTFIRDQFTVRRLSDIPGILAGARPLTRVAVITFDDALSDFREHAYPLLARLGMPATVFVPTAYLGRTNLWEAGTGVPSRSLMSAAEVEALHREGLVEFGSHTTHHVRLGAVDEDVARRELSESRDSLEQLLSVAVTLFAYPYGMPDDIPPYAERLLESTGYRAACCSHWGTRASLRSRFSLRRIRLSEQDDSATVLYKMRGLYDWVGAKESVGAIRRRLALRWRGTDRPGHE